MSRKNLPIAYLEINKKNLIHNIKQFTSLQKPETKIVAVVKANAYGHGDKEIVKVLDPYVGSFAVNSVQELESLRNVSKKEILVLGYTAETDIERAMKMKCVISIFSITHLKNIGKVSSKLKNKQEINIAIDAHLGREGILVSDLSDFIKELNKYKYLKLAGVYAHFANIEDTPDFTHAKKQIEQYNKALRILKDFGYEKFATHISATSGLLIYENNLGIGLKNLDIHTHVRVGIGLYGLWPAEYLKEIYLKKNITLKPVLSYKTLVAQVKILPKGETVGYGLTFKTKRQTKTAVIPQGYADGVDRRLSNVGEVLIGGKRCKILGRVMMNMFVVDVSHLKIVKAEDEVVLIGRQGREEITPEEIAGKLYTINYEITTRLSALLPRILA